MNHFLIFSFLLLSCSLVLSHSDHQCHCEQGPSEDQIKSYKKNIQSCFDLNKQNLDLFSKCSNERYTPLSSISFQNNQFQISKYNTTSFLPYFKSIERNRASCGNILLPEDQLPDQEYHDLSKIISRFHEKTPILFEPTLLRLLDALHSIKTYLLQCTSKDKVLQAEIFRNNGPGEDISDVTFLPKNDLFSGFTFNYDFMRGLSQSEQPDGKLLTPLLQDLLNVVDRHFIPSIITPIYPSDSVPLPLFPLQNLEDPRGPQGYQIVFLKEEYKFKVLSSINVRIELQGTLILYVFDSNGKLKESLRIPEINTYGPVRLLITGLNLQLQDHDSMMLYYEGEGAIGRRETKSSGEAFTVTRNLMFLNQYVLRDRFENPKVGHKFEIESCKHALDAEVEWVRQAGKRMVNVSYLKLKEEF